MNFKAHAAEEHSDAKLRLEGWRAKAGRLGG